MFPSIISGSQILVDPIYTFSQKMLAKVTNQKLKKQAQNGKIEPVLFEMGVGGVYVSQIRIARN